MDDKMNGGDVEYEETKVEVTREMDPSPPPTRSKRLIYTVNDVPPFYLSLLLGFQHYITMFGGTVTVPYLLSAAFCIKNDDPARAYIISTAFFMSGLATFLQTTFGIRLPIVQGATFAFMTPVLSILALPEWKCPSDETISKLDDAQRTELWQVRMREVQGAIIAASCAEILIGFSGLVGSIIRWITPLTIVPTIALISLNLFGVAAEKAGENWIFSSMTIILMVLFSQYLTEVGIPYRWGGSKDNSRPGNRQNRFYLFKLFPILLSIIVVWALCAILTVTDTIPRFDPARTDNRTIILTNSPWFRFPYPFQWGWPTFTLSSILGVVAGVLASTIESVGDYYACSRLSEAPPPPTHAINRGIFMEGIACVFCGMWGWGGGLTSYSENVGAIGVTRVGSRTVTQMAGLLMMTLSLLTKFGALFVTIPEPIMGGVFCVTFGMIAAVGLSNLQYVDLNSTRNLFVLGFSIFMGLVLPNWINKNPMAVQTGAPELDKIITVLLSTGMFVGGLFGFVLDNTIPGTPEERGVKRWLSEMKILKHAHVEEDAAEVDLVSQCYDLPFGLTALLKKWPLSRFIPISPTFDGPNGNNSDSNHMNNRSGGHGSEPQRLNVFRTSSPSLKSDGKPGSRPGSRPGSGTGSRSASPNLEFTTSV